MAALRYLIRLLVPFARLADSLRELADDLRGLALLGKRGLEHYLASRGVADSRRSDPEQVVHLHQQGRDAEARRLLQEHDPTDTLPRELRKLRAFLDELLEPRAHRG